MSNASIVSFFRRAFDKKWKLFTFFLALAALTAAIVSALTYTTVLGGSAARPAKLAVIAPFSGPNQAIGAAIFNGAALVAKETNERNGAEGRRLRIVSFDAPDPAAAKAALERAARDPDVVAVLGDYENAADDAAAAAHRELRLPGIGFATAFAADTKEPWLFSPAADESFEVKFLANYVRNVISEKLVSVVYPANAEGEAMADTFDKTLQRFGTKVLYKFPVDFAAPDSLKTLVAGAADKKLVGTVAILADPAQSAAAFAALRQGGLRNPVVGLRTLATTAFKTGLAAQWRGPGSLGSALNGTLMTTPVLFDTSGVAAQEFRAAYTDRYRAAPDWLAAIAYDSARLLSDALAATDPRGKLQASELRPKLRDRLARYDLPARAFAGINGAIFFDRGGAPLPTMIGVYDGSDLVAGLTQLSPIRDEGVANYLQELVAGRALYVNDRFMYKTNVVYSGIKLDKISNLDREAMTADLEFTIWFRWRGDFEPQDIVFANAAKPIKLEKPDREGVIGDLNYRAYRVKDTFFLNHDNVPHGYGTQLVGVLFHHRTLNRNNVMYVSDLLGMGLGADQAVKPADAASDSAKSVLQRLLHGISLGPSDPLLAQLKRSQVLAGANGWVIDRAWISQEVSNTSADGDPNFVGFGRPKPEFSMLDLGVLLKPDSLDLIGLLPRNVMIYIAIFALAGAILAALLDRKERGQFWRMQTLILRAVTWPVLLLTLGTLVLDYSAQHWTGAATDLVVLAYNALWWLVPALLLTILVERFIWVPIENRTGRKVPMVLRHLVVVVIFALAGFGIVAFVLGKTITSLLAASGLLTLIVGLAVQSNLNDVWSGIVLNVERPFTIGDDIKIGDLYGRVLDITWRTTRIRSIDGQLVSYPNGRLSDSEIHNFSRSETATQKLDIDLDPKHDPQLVLSVLRAALKEAAEAAKPEKPVKTRAAFEGVHVEGGARLAHYEAVIEGPDFRVLKAIAEQLWEKLWPLFQRQGIAWEIETPAAEAAPAPHRQKHG